MKAVLLAPVQVLEVNGTVNLAPRLGVFTDPDAPHLKVRWTDQELADLFSKSIFSAPPGSGTKGAAFA